MAFTSTINTSLLTTYLEKTFVAALEKELHYWQFTTKGSMPEGGGNILRFNVFANPPGTTASLTEGTTTGNEITTLTTTGTNTTIVEYGEFIKVNQFQEYAAVKGTRSELSDRMAYGGALAIDSLIRNAALTTTNAFYCTAAAAGGTTTASTPTALNASAVVSAAAIIRDLAAQGFSGVSGHPDGDYAGMISTGSEADMITENTTGRATWSQINMQVPGVMGQEKAVRGRMGGVYGTTCYRTQNYTQTTVTSLSDNNVILGKGAVGAAGFDDMKARVILNEVNSPYKNVNSIAWHAYFGTSLIDSSRVIRLYSLS